jgi:Flp pilus assembly protein protease CpaA
VLVPVVIFVVCFAGGTAGAARWLPDLDVGPIGGIAFFLVCGLAGAALAVVGLHVYSLVSELEKFRIGPGVEKGEIVAGVLRNIAIDAGSLTGFAAIVYLLAPQLDRFAPGRPIAPSEIESVE